MPALLFGFNHMHPSITGKIPINTVKMKWRHLGSIPLSDAHRSDKDITGEGGFLAHMSQQSWPNAWPPAIGAKCLLKARARG